MAPGKRSYREEGVIERIESNTLFRISMIATFLVIVAYVFIVHLSCSRHLEADHPGALKPMESRSLRQI